MSGVNVCALNREHASAPGQSGKGNYSSLIAACVAVINGRGNIPCHHNFGVLLATAFQLTVQRLVRIAIEPKVPVEAILGDKNLGDEGFQYTLGDAFSLVAVSVLLQSILEDGQLFSVSVSQCVVTSTSIPGHARVANSFATSCACWGVIISQSAKDCTY